MGLTFVDSPSLSDQLVGCVPSANYTLAVPGANNTAGWPVLAADVSKLCRFTSPALLALGSPFGRAAQQQFLNASLSATACNTWSAVVSHHPAVSAKQTTSPFAGVVIGAAAVLAGPQPTAFFAAHEYASAHYAPPAGVSTADSALQYPASLTSNFFTVGAGGAASYLDLAATGTPALAALRRRARRSPSRHPPLSTSASLENLPQPASQQSSPLPLLNPPAPFAADGPPPTTASPSSPPRPSPSSPTSSIWAAARAAPWAACRATRARGARPRRAATRACAATRRSPPRARCCRPRTRSRSARRSPARSRSAPRPGAPAAPPDWAW